MEWKEVKLGDLCSKVYSGGTPKSTEDSYYGGGIPWLNTKEVNFNRVYTTEKDISEDGLNNSSAKWIPENTVTIAMYGATAGKSCIVKTPMTTNQACCNLIIDSKKADYELVFYALKNLYGQLASLANGGAQQNLNAQIIKDFEIYLPTAIDDQRKIASILSSLDAKIETNNRINAKLEEMAQALFKSWFIDFEPFQDQPFHETELGMIPEGWRVGTLDDISSFISRGLSPKYGESAELVLGQTCVRNNIVTMTNARTHVPKAKNSKKVEQWDTLINSTGIGSLGRVGGFYFDMDNVSFDSHLTVVRAKDPEYAMYICRNLLSRQAEIENNAVGSTGQTELPRDSVKAIPIVIPPVDVARRFGDFVKPLCNRMITNTSENKELAELRDVLLPKLMNGEIEV